MKRVMILLVAVLIVIIGVGVAPKLWANLGVAKGANTAPPPPPGPAKIYDLFAGRGEGQEIMGWQGVDLRKTDFSEIVLEQMWRLTFNNRTRWPGTAALPKGFSPQAVLEAAKDPGLGVTKLHQQGITGKGIAVAVIDNPMREKHREFEDRLTYTFIEDTRGLVKNPWLHFHGAATASILGGKTVGVAPGTRIHYYGVNGSLADAGGIAKAIDMVLEQNQKLPRAEQVRIISISMGIAQPLDVFKAAITKAEAAGVAVVHCGEWFPAPFTLTGAEPGRDRSDPESYTGSPQRLAVPAHFRTTASGDGPDLYAYWGVGGASWAAPYMAGVIALGMQVNPDLTPEQAYKLLLETATVTSSGSKVINPAGFVDRVKSR